MRATKRAVMLCALAMLVACGEPPPPRSVEAPAKPAPHAPPPEIAAMAQSVLGAETEVLVFGDLALTGRQQVLVVNRLPKTPAGMVPGILVTRAVVVENDRGTWKEVLRCDEHLKNPNGFLGATPIAPVNGWRLQFERNAERGLLLFFTPLAQPSGGHIPSIGVRWNPQVKRYQSLDRNFEHFLGEVPSLEKFHSSLR